MSTNTSYECQTPMSANTSYECQTHTSVYPSHPYAGDGASQDGASGRKLFVGGVAAHENNCRGKNRILGYKTGMVCTCTSWNNLMTLFSAIGVDYMWE